jgi:hypothetical protein
MVVLRGAGEGRVQVFEVGIQGPTLRLVVSSLPSRRIDRVVDVVGVFDREGRQRVSARFQERRIAIRASICPATCTRTAVTKAMAEALRATRASRMPALIRETVSTASPDQRPPPRGTSSIVIAAVRAAGETEEGSVASER